MVKTIIGKEIFDRLSELSEDCDSVWKKLESVYPQWRKEKVPEFQFRYLSEVQEAIGKCSEKVKDILGSVDD